MDEKKKSKTKLIISIVSAVALVIILSLGIFLAVKYSKDDGNIDITANEVDITVSAEVLGMKNPPKLPNIVINKDTAKNQSWKNVSLQFDDKNSQIDIVVTIKNNNQESMLQVLFANNTTLDNLVKEEACYYNGNSENLLPVQSTMVVGVGERLSYKISFNIKDASRSVNDELALNFVCSAVLP